MTGDPKRLLNRVIPVTVEVRVEGGADLGLEKPDASPDPKYRTSSSRVHLRGSELNGLPTLIWGEFEWNLEGSMDSSTPKWSRMMRK